MTSFATIGIIIAILAIIYFTTKGLHIVIAAPIATLIVILTNDMTIFETLIGKQNSYMTGLSSFLINNFAIFLLGSILAGYMESSGATYTIAKFILDKVGKDSPFKVLLSITIIAAVLTYGGISIFIVIFAIIPLAKPLFKELNISWELFPIPVFLGASTFTMTMLPATPSIHNTIPTKVLKTSLTSAPLISIVGTITIIIFGLCYMHFALKKYKDVSFDNELDGQKISELSDVETPKILISILPILTLIVTIFIFSKVPNIVLISLTISIILSTIIFRKYLKDSLTVLNNGAIGSVMPAFATSSSVAFGTVLTSAVGFEVIKNAITNIPGSPLIGLSVATALLSAITGSSSGAIGIAINSFVPSYVEMGLNPELIHRVVVVASAALTVVPQSGVMITFNSLAGLSIKRGFKHSFWIVNGGHIVALTVMLLVASFIY